MHQKRKNRYLLYKKTFLSIGLNSIIYKFKRNFSFYNCHKKVFKIQPDYI